MPGREDDFTAAAEALYAVPAPDFIAARTARAKEARATGARDLAARIAALPKPTAAAALVNLLANEGADDLEEVLALGDDLRAAQEDADGDRLRALGARRRDLLAEVTGRTADRAGVRPGAAVLEEFQQTLQAALADEDAAAAVRTGRLLRGLSADGLDPVDLADAVGGPDGIRAAARPRGPGAASGREEEDRRAAEERDAAEAAERAAATRRTADEAADRAAAASEDLHRREATVAECESALAAAEQALAAARADRDAAAAAAEEASAARDAADRAADDAERASAASETARRR